MITKKKMIEMINEKINEDDMVGERIVCMKDAWRDAIGDELNKMKWKQLKKIVIDNDIKESILDIEDEES